MSETTGTTATPETAPAAPEPTSAPATVSAPSPAPQSGAEAPSILTAAAESAKTGPSGQPTVPAEIEIKLPEGVKAEEVQLAQFKSLAKELGLDSAKAQKAFDAQLNAQKSWATQIETAFHDQQKQWVAEVKADKELGGPNFDATQAAARKFMVTFDPDGSLRKELDSHGLGNLPALVRLVARAAKALNEDSVGNVGAGGKPTQEDSLRLRYPTMFQDQQ